MKRIEGILTKIVLIQTVFLLMSQIFLHHFDVFPELKERILYEGVGTNHAEIVETLNQP